MCGDMHKTTLLPNPHSSAFGTKALAFVLRPALSPGGGSTTDGSSSTSPGGGFTTMGKCQDCGVAPGTKTAAVASSLVLLLATLAGTNVVALALMVEELPSSEV